MNRSSRPGGVRPGMNDVADLAGVSHQTVSRVLNGHANVRPATREQVLTAINQLGYRRNRAARALVTRRTGTIGVVTTGSMEFGPASTLTALEQEARSAGYFVTVATAGAPEGFGAVFDSLLDQAVEAVVVIAPVHQAAIAAEAFGTEVPVLLLAARPDDAAAVPALYVDQAAGVRAVADHLLGLGHRDMVQITGPPDWLDAQVRAEAWHASLAHAGVSARADRQGDWSAASGYEAARSLLAELPQAVFAGNDQMALGVLHAFAEAGISVPGEVSVVGFDDIAGADHYLPPLTTVQQDFRTLGRRAIEVLVAQIRGAVAATDPVSPTLIERASTGPAR